MRTLSPVEQEINRIRLEIYEETKDMTAEQRREYYRKSGEIAVKEFGVKRIASAKDDPRLRTL
jgi:hypothetical protein